MRAAYARLRGRYFTSALPRALLGAAPLVPLGVLWERRLWPQATAALLYVLLYSTLPHKARPRDVVLLRWRCLALLGFA
jgi:hypothetical protein